IRRGIGLTVPGEFVGITEVCPAPMSHEIGSEVLGRKAGEEVCHLAGRHTVPDVKDVLHVVSREGVPGAMSRTREIGDARSPGSRGGARFHGCSARQYDSPESL